MNRLVFALASATAVLSAALTVQAGFITYSGSGRLYADRGDPWGVGRNVTPFEISVTLDDSGPDVDSRTGVANFSRIVAATFKIGGAEAEWLPFAAQLVQYRESTGGNDLLGLLIGVRFAGSSQGVFAAFPVAATTFALTQPFETPKLFETTTASVTLGNPSGSTPFRSDYLYVSVVGTTVAATAAPAAVPEPGSLLLAALGGLGLIGGAARKRRRRPA